MMSKWLKIVPKRVKMAQSMVKMGQNRPTSLKMAQNRPKWPKAERHCQRNGNCDQISRRGTADGIDLRPLGRQGPNLGHKGGPKATFAAKFGMHLGVLTVFSGPVHGRGAQRESNWLKQAQNRQCL